MNLKTKFGLLASSLFLLGSSFFVSSCGEKQKVTVKDSLNDVFIQTNSEFSPWVYPPPYIDIVEASIEKRNDYLIMEINVNGDIPVSPQGSPRTDDADLRYSFHLDTNKDGKPDIEIYNGRISDSENEILKYYTEMYPLPIEINGSRIAMKIPRKYEVPAESLTWYAPQSFDWYATVVYLSFHEDKFGGDWVPGKYLPKTPNEIEWVSFP